MMLPGVVEPLVYLQDPKLFTPPRGLEAVLDQFSISTTGRTG